MKCKKIVRLHAGFGNQMFQYALYLKLQKINGIENVFVHNCIEPQTPNILEVFSLTPQYASEKLIERLRDVNMSFMSRVVRKIRGRRTYYETDKMEYEELPLSKSRSLYLYGYWQSEKYFIDIREEILRTFNLEHALMKYSQDVRDFNEERLREIKQTNSISVHIRRGDYVQLSSKFGGICTDKYYHEAMNYFRNKYSDAKFYIFTNDLAWAEGQEMFQADDCKIINGNEGKNDELDMLLMSKCKHNIIANSSFSWWGAWLNEYNEKEVIAPAKWIHTLDASDVYCQGWKIIDGRVS